MTSRLDSEIFDFLAIPGGGRLILSAQPAKFGNLDQVLAAYRTAGAQLLISLLPDHELLSLQLTSMQERCARVGLQWAQCPIDDFSVPGELFEQRWSATALGLHSLLNQGAGVALHCRAGLGRTGTVAARVLIERGLSAPVAMQLVRQARPGSIETSTQEDYLLGFRPVYSLGSDVLGKASGGVPR